MHAHDIITIASVLLAGFICHWISWRTKLPAILFLLIAGISAGPVLGWLDTDALLGDLLLPVVSLAVAVILFEGSLTLKVSEIRGHGGVVRNLISFGVLITWFTAGFSAHILLGWDIQLAALFGAIVTVSGPTVVMPLLRAVRPTPEVSSVLRWEAILIDPLGAILALLTFDVIVATQAAAGMTAAAKSVAIIAIAGTAIGIAGGQLFGLAIRRRLLPDFLRDYAALSAVLSVFALSEAVQGEAGLLAVTVMGIWLANMRGVHLDDVMNFKESLTLLLVAGLFILLAARLNLQDLIATGMGAVILIAILQFVAGPLRALVCAIGSPLAMKERLFLGWVFPRGIVAAAISALFALRLEQSGVDGADKLVPLVFSVIIGTVIIQSLTTRPLARWLGVAAPAPTGVLVVGSNPVALAFAKALHDAGLSVLVADSHWASIREARMQGLRVFYGSAVSAYADNHLNLDGIGVLLAASRQPGLNELACVRYAEEFGRDHVYTIGHKAESGHAKHMISGESRGRVIFNGEHTIEDLLVQIHNDMVAKSTELSEEFDFTAYTTKHPACLPIFSIDKDQEIHFPVADEDFEPQAGWTIAALLPVKSPAEAAAEHVDTSQQVPTQ